MMKVILSLFALLLLLSSCASKKRVVVESKAFPLWYENPVQSNFHTLYGVGAGESKRSAINNALNEILASLSVNISSEFNSKTEVSKGTKENYQVTSSSKVNSRVQEIKINNYQVIHENDFAFEKYLVGVKIEKNQLFSGLKKRLDSSFEAIKNKSKKTNALHQLESYEEDKWSLSNVSNIVSVMHALDSTFNDSVYLQKMSQIDNKYTNLLSKISFSLHAKQDSMNLKSSIAEGLTYEKFHLNTSRDKNHFRVHISSVTNKAYSFGFDLARCAIDIKVKDYKGRVIGSNKINLTGQSTQGYNIAKENVAMKLSKKIKKEGIAKVLGLGI